MSEELKPCPFCGGEAERITLQDQDNFGGDVISCKKCECCTRVLFGEKEGIAESWNARAELATLKVGQGEAVAIAECREVHGHMCQFLNRTQHGMDTLRDGDKLYTAPPTTADARLVPVELLELCFEGFDDYWVASPEGIECTGELRALLTQSKEG